MEKIGLIRRESRRRRCRWKALWLGALLVAAARAESAEDQPQQQRIGPFVVRSEFSLSPYAGLFNQLEHIQRDLTRTLAVRPPSQPIVMHLFRDRSRYRAFVRRNFPEAPDRQALFVKRGETSYVMAYRSEQFETDLRHETTHALLHADLPMVPLWLDEGLAEYFEQTPGSRATGNPYLASLRWTTAFGLAPNLPALEGIARVEDMTGTQYRYAWAWVHFMLHGPREAHAELVRYLADIRRRAPPGRLSERLERRLPGVHKRLVEHYRSWRY